MAPKRVTISLNDAEQFFWDHAGYSYDPATEDAKSGRAKGAVNLARAEKYMNGKSDIVVTWELDDIPYDGDVPYDGPTYSAMIVRITDCLATPIGSRYGSVLGSLGGITIDSDDPEHTDYGRVIAAELADEYL